MKLFSLILIVMTGFAFAGDGTTGFTFLQVRSGARAVAMGGAFSAIQNDPLALYWNPAAAATVTSTKLSTSYASYMMDMQAGFIGWVNPRSEDAIGVSLNYFYGGSFNRTSMENPMGDGEQFSSNSMALAGTWAKSITDNISVGATGRFIYSQIDSYNANGFSVDIGGLFTPSALPGFTVAAVARNAGIQTKAFYSENDPMPTELTAGVSQVLLDEKLIIAVDGTMPFEGAVDVAAGFEYKPIEILSLRSGWSLKAKDTADNAGGGFIDAMAFGMGTEYNQYSFDYAWKPYADLGNTHRITIGVNF